MRYAEISVILECLVDKALAYAKDVTNSLYAITLFMIQDRDTLLQISGDSPTRHWASEDCLGSQPNSGNVSATADFFFYFSV